MRGKHVTCPRLAVIIWLPVMRKPASKLPPLVQQWKALSQRHARVLGPNFAPFGYSFITDGREGRVFHSLVKQLVRAFRWASASTAF